MVVPAVALVLVVGGIGSVLAINLQTRLMHAAGDAQMLGAALNYSALNIANGLGAWVGPAWGCPAEHCDEKDQTYDPLRNRPRPR